MFPQYEKLYYYVNDIYGLNGDGWDYDKFDSPLVFKSQEHWNLGEGKYSTVGIIDDDDFYIILKAKPSFKRFENIADSYTLEDYPDYTFTLNDYAHVYDISWECYICCKQDTSRISLANTEITCKQKKSAFTTSGFWKLGDTDIVLWDQGDYDSFNRYIYPADGEVLLGSGSFEYYDYYTRKANIAFDEFTVDNDLEITINASVQTRNYSVTIGGELLSADMPIDTSYGNSEVWKNGTRIYNTLDSNFIAGAYDFRNNWPSIELLTVPMSLKNRFTLMDISPEVGIEYVITDKGFSNGSQVAIEYVIKSLSGATEIYSISNYIDIDDTVIGINSFSLDFLNNPELLDGFYDKTAESGAAEFTIQFIVSLIPANEAADYITDDSHTGSYFSLIKDGPIINATITDTNAVSVSYTGSAQVLVRYISNAKVLLDITPQKGATITNIRLIHGGFTYENYTELDFERVVSNKFTVYATDSRGITSRVIYEPDMVEYVPVSCNLKASRPTGEGEVNIEIFGNYWNGNFGVESNELFVYYKYRKKTEEEFTDWIRATSLSLDTGANTYRTYGLNIENLDYMATYVFQALAVDIYGNVYSSEVTVVSTPVFDWSASDFNFNVPVTIQGQRFGKGQEPKELWSGQSQMVANDTITLAEPIKDQATGVMLVFSASSGDVSWNTFFVPKAMIDYYNGGGQSFLMVNNAGLATVGAKYLYITDTSITGHASNNASVVGTGSVPASSIINNNSYYVLRYVFGV